MTGGKLLISETAERWSTRKQTRRALSALYEAMEGNPQVVSAEMADHGVLVRFDDGKNGLLPATLLYAILPQALHMQMAEEAEAERKLRNRAKRPRLI